MRPATFITIKHKLNTYNNRQEEMCHQTIKYCHKLVNQLAKRSTCKDQNSPTGNKVHVRKTIDNNYSKMENLVKRQERILVL